MSPLSPSGKDGSACEGLARARVCNWHQKSRAQPPLRGRSGFLWEGRCEACVQDTLSAIRSVLSLWRQANSIPVLC